MIMVVIPIITGTMHDEINIDLAAMIGHAVMTYRIGPA